MGSHTSFHNVIHCLILHQKEFSRLNKLKYQDIFLELSKYTIEPDSENEGVPDQRILAEKFGIKQNRMNSLLKEIYKDFIDNIYAEPLVIKSYYHTIHFALDPDDFNGTIMENIKKATEQATIESMVLPVTPQIGNDI
jgi:hypothetical protein